MDMIKLLETIERKRSTFVIQIFCAPPLSREYSPDTPPLLDVDSVVSSYTDNGVTEVS